MIIKKICKQTWSTLDGAKRQNVIWHWAIQLLLLTLLLQSNDSDFVEFDGTSDTVEHNHQIV